MKKPNPSKHIKDNLDHVFNWSVGQCWLMLQRTCFNEKS